jgi:hypothetical protein
LDDRSKLEFLGIDCEKLKNKIKQAKNLNLIINQVIFFYLYEDNHKIGLSDNEKDLLEILKILNFIEMD